MLGTTPEDLAQFLHQEERLDSVIKELIQVNENLPNMLTMCKLIKKVFNHVITAHHCIRLKWENSSEIMTVLIKR